MGRPSRPGRLPRWQRWTTHAVLLCCAVTGTAWFVLLDIYDAMPGVTKPWWIGHGIAAAFATLCIGGAASQHVAVNWRLRRARIAGTSNLVLLATLIVTALYLLYGGGAGHDAVHWLHVGAGLVGVILFIAHVLLGRRARAGDGARAVATESTPARAARTG